MCTTVKISLNSSAVVREVVIGYFLGGGNGVHFGVYHGKFSLNSAVCRNPSMYISKMILSVDNYQVWYIGIAAFVVVIIVVIDVFVVKVVIVVIVGVFLPGVMRPAYTLVVCPSA